MGKKVAQNSHEVPELKSFKPWKAGMKAKRRVLVRNQETGEPVQDENGDPMYEMVSQPISADKKSQMKHLHMSSKTQRFWGVLWNQADKCQLFRQKVSKVQNEDGTWSHRCYPKTEIPIVDRGNRALSGHTLKTLASGAVATVNAQMHADALTLRLQTKKGEPLAPEDTKYPMLPTYSVGAAYAIEAAFIAYVQEIFSTAREIQQVHKKTHSKVTAKCCQAAADIVNKRLASATSFVPETVSFRKAPKQKKAKAAEGEAAKAKA